MQASLRFAAFTPIDKQSVSPNSFWGLAALDHQPPARKTPTEDPSAWEMYPPEAHRLLGQPDVAPEIRHGSAGAIALTKARLGYLPSTTALVSGKSMLTLVRS